MTVAPERQHDNTAVPLEDRLLIDEVTAAAMCGVSRPTFREWVAAGLIAPVALPFNLRRNLYRREALDALVAGLGASS